MHKENQRHSAYAMPIRFKLLYSFPGRVILLGLPFGLLREATRSAAFSWEGVLLSTIIFGGITAFLTKKTFAPPPELKDPSTWTITDSIRSGKLPQDSKLIKTLPSELDTREANIAKARKQFLPFMVVIAIVFFIFTLTEHKVAYGIYALLALIIGILNHFAMARMLRKIDALRKQLP